MHDPDLIFPFPFTGVGSDFAQYISSHDTITNKPYVNRSHKLLEQSMICLGGYIILSYIYLGEENIESSTDDGGGEKFWVAATPRNQLVVSAMFAVLGAYIGHLLVDMISEKLRHPLIPMETLICNVRPVGLDAQYDEANRCIMGRLLTLTRICTKFLWSSIIIC